MFKEIIEKLLILKANLNAKKEQKILEAVQLIEQEFSDTEVNIDIMLNKCGYVAPVEEIANETENESQVNEVNYSNETI